MIATCKEKVQLKHFKSYKERKRCQQGHYFRCIRRCEKKNVHKINFQKYKIKSIKSLNNKVVFLKMRRILKKTTKTKINTLKTVDFWLKTHKNLRSLF